MSIFIQAIAVIETLQDIFRSMYFDQGNVSVFARCETSQVYYTFGFVSFAFKQIDTFLDCTTISFEISRA